MKQRFTEEEFKRAHAFLVETFELTEEQLAAIHHQLPMSQDLFEQIIRKCEEIGTELDKLFYKLLDEYPDLMEAYSEKIKREVEEANLPPMSPDVKERIRQNLFSNIHSSEQKL